MIDTPPCPLKVVTNLQEAVWDVDIVVNALLSTEICPVFQQIRRFWRERRTMPVIISLAKGVKKGANAQHIWNEVGESNSDKDRMLLQLEQECLEVYRRKVDHASHARAQLHKDLANAEAEYSALLSALGEAPISLCVSSHSYPTC
ncbi:unnamed protein product [Sphagnum tenellum]